VILAQKKDTHKFICHVKVILELTEFGVWNLYFKAALTSGHCFFLEIKVVDSMVI
jgi:hypothetical protein